MPRPNRRWTESLFRPARPARRPDRTLSVTPLEDRCNPAPIGSLDPSFGTDGTSDLTDPGEFNAVAPTGDGGFVAVGFTRGPGGDVDTLVRKFRADGTTDPTFNGGDPVVRDVSGANLDDLANAVFVRPDGTILIAGTARILGDDDMFLISLSADGTTVAGPGPRDVGGNATDDSANAIAVNDDGEVFLVGSTVDPVAGDADFAIVKYDANLGFINDQRIVVTGGDDVANAAVIGPDGRVFLAGSANNGSDIGLARIAADLSDRLAMSVDAGGTGEAASDIAFGPTGRLYIAGASNPTGGLDFDFLAAEIDPADLTLIASQTYDLGGTDGANALSVDGFNRLVLVGQANLTPAFASDLAVVRVSADTLELDPSFAEDGKSVIDAGNGFEDARDLFLDANGQIVAVGTNARSQVAIRVVGTVGRPTSVIATGPDNGAGTTFSRNDTFDGLATTPEAIADPLIPGVPVRVAQADVNGDGVLDTIAASGPGGGTVRVTDGANGTVIAEFSPFEDGFTGGLFVAAADFTGDGKAEIVVSPDNGGGAVVAIYDGAEVVANPNRPADYMRFFGLVDQNGVGDEENRNGVRVAVGDINGDGVPDLVVGAGLGGGPRVTVFDGLTIRDKTADDGIAPMANFLVFEENQRDGAFVAVGDVNGDGMGDLVIGGGPSGGLRVRIADGAALTAQGITFGLDPDANTGTLNNFFIDGDQESRAGIRVMTADVDGDELADLITGSGDDTEGTLKVIPGSVLARFPSGTQDPPTDDLDPMFGVVPTGVFVG